LEDYVAELEEENEGLRERLSNIVDFASDEEEEAEEKIDDGDSQDDEGPEGNRIPPHLIAATIGASPLKPSPIEPIASAHRAPAGPRLCVLCGSTRFFIIDHRDGDEWRLQRTILEAQYQHEPCRIG
jgi:hypothetical protein